MKEFIIADNQELTRYALEHLIGEGKDSAVYVASNRAGLVKQLTLHPGAVVILDYTLFDFQDEDQLLIVAERFSLSEWILFSDELAPQFVRRVVYSSHQFSVVLKDSSVSELRQAIIMVSQHNRYLSQRAMETIIAQQQEEKQMSNYVLTQTETEIVRAIAQGKTTRRLPPSDTSASILSPPTARISFANWVSTPPTKLPSMPFVPALWTRRSSTYSLEWEGKRVFWGA